MFGLVQYPGQSTCLARMTIIAKNLPSSMAATQNKLCLAALFDSVLLRDHSLADASHLIIGFANHTAVPLAPHFRVDSSQLMFALVVAEHRRRAQCAKWFAEPCMILASAFSRRYSQIFLPRSFS